MRTITLLQPKRLVFGRGCAADCGRDLQAAGYHRPFVVTSPETAALVNGVTAAMPESAVTVSSAISGEPDVAMFEAALSAAREAQPDVVIGLGGGSAMDVAKLVAALLAGNQSVRDVFGINILVSRNMPLVCLPTTSGTGSEVSPNAILLDESENLKKGVVSPHLVPDAAYVDPLLTLSCPPGVTAATGMDALIHCLEAYTNRFAHPIVDVIALEGIRLISAHLRRAVVNGSDLEAREKLALGSMYGGMCLGPVNTAAVHALAYPLGGEFHIAHGVSTTVLLPHVMEYNLPAAVERHADLAVALGAAPGRTAEETAFNGVGAVRALARDCGITRSLAQIGVPEDAIPRMAEAAMKVTRLLKNNPREMTVEAATAIFRRAWSHGVAAAA